MNLVIIHYHLGQGGVTSVIANHLRSLRSRADEYRFVILHGGNVGGWPASIDAGDLTLVAVPQLGYSAEKPDSSELTKAISGALAQLGCSADDTILHFHNHSLTKNTAYPDLVRDLALRGYRQLLQIHDFPEDCRPDNYSAIREALDGDDVARRLYPQASHLHYAVLNRRDYEILNSAGIRQPNLHLLPNPVALAPDKTDREAAARRYRAAFDLSDDTRILLYPVRGIRRKNLGEALLWTALSAAKVSVGITLAPTNPTERPRYQHWKDLAASLNQPCLFEVGEKAHLEFGQLLAAADANLTTSVAEGFGMVFLESYAAGNLLVGRNLPDITDDFEQSGVDLSQLNPQLRVPIDLIGYEYFLDEFETTARAVRSKYQMLEPPKRSEVEGLVRDGLVDFAYLGVQGQNRVIDRAVKSAGDRRRILDANPALDRLLRTDWSEYQPMVARNKRVVSDHYNLAVAGDTLHSILTAVGQSTVASDLSPPDRSESILAGFLELKRLYPIRL